MANTLPIYGMKSGPGVGGSASSVQVPEYIRRIFQYPQMDIDYTLWQMLYLCVSPSRVYRTTKYHKQTKNQWARDDPAFVAIMMYFMTVAALGYTIAFHRSLGGFFRGVVYAVVIDFGLVGIIAATVGWYVANHYLLVDHAGSHATEQKEGLVIRLLANSVYALAFSYYFYITFLGYDVLPFLQHTTVFLYPVVFVLVIVALCSLLRVNICRAVMQSYFG